MVAADGTRHRTRHGEGGSSLSEFPPIRYPDIKDPFVSAEPESAIDSEIARLRAASPSDLASQEYVFMAPGGGAGITKGKKKNKKPKTPLEAAMNGEDLGGYPTKLGKPGKKGKKGKAIKMFARELRTKIATASSAPDRDRALFMLDTLSVGAPLLAKSAKKVRKSLGVAPASLKLNDPVQLHRRLQQEVAGQRPDLLDPDPYRRDRAFSQEVK